MSQLGNAKDHISRQRTSILKGWYNVCLVTVIGLDSSVACRLMHDTAHDHAVS